MFNSRVPFEMQSRTKGRCAWLLTIGFEPGPHNASLSGSCHVDHSNIVCIGKPYSRTPGGEGFLFKRCPLVGWIFHFFRIVTINRPAAVLEWSANLLSGSVVKGYLDLWHFVITASPTLALHASPY